MKTLKAIVLLLCLLQPNVWCQANSIESMDGHSTIQIKEAGSYPTPKSSSIQATIDGHTLSVVFLENLGQVTIEITYAIGGEVETSSIHTPNGVNFYISNTGSYVVTFTLPNGDEYYGEFEVTD